MVNNGEQWINLDNHGSYVSHEMANILMVDVVHHGYVYIYMIYDITDNMIS